MQIVDKVFVVTGGGNGIGREVVLRLLERGARVAALDLRQESLEETSQLAGSGSSRLTLHTVDVSHPDEVSRAFAEVISAHGHCDGLLNIAGIIQKFVPVVDLDIAEMTRVMGVNFWGVVYTTKAALPHLLSRPEACLVNVSSMGGFTPVPGQTAYGASKAAVKLFTEGLFAELRGSHVAVTIVFPGAVSTDISGNSGVSIPTASAAQGEKTSFPTTSPQAAAAQIIEAVEKGPYRVTIGRDATMLDRLSRLAPQRATEMIAKKMASLLSS